MFDHQINLEELNSIHGIPNSGQLKTGIELSNIFESNKEHLHFEMLQVLSIIKKYPNRVNDCLTILVKESLVGG